MDINIDEFVEKNKDKVENILFYAYDRFASSKYALSLQEVNIITKTLGLKVKQKVESFNYYTPEVSVSQSYTFSNYVTNFSRFYDDGEKIKFINASNVSDINKNKFKTLDLTYDEYLSEYGKLFKRKYYVKKNDMIIGNLNDIYSHDEIDSKLRYGISIYEICDFTYKFSKVMKQGKNYRLLFSLDCQMSHQFFVKQIKNTAHMTSEPIFSNSEIEFELDSSLNLISSVSKDRYKVKFGLINLDIEMESTNSYFISSSNRFKNKKNAIEVEVPNEKTIEFNGYRLKK